MRQCIVKQESRMSYIRRSSWSMRYGKTTTTIDAETWSADYRSVITATNKKSLDAR
jgi:hypothetical protein